MKPDPFIGREAEMVRLKGLLATRSVHFLIFSLCIIL